MKVSTKTSALVIVPAEISSLTRLIIFVLNLININFGTYLTLELKANPTVKIHPKNEHITVALVSLIFN